MHCSDDNSSKQRDFDRMEMIGYGAYDHKAMVEQEQEKVER